MTEKEIQRRLKLVKLIFVISLLLAIAAVAAPISVYKMELESVEQSDRIFFQSSGNLAIMICMVLDVFVMWSHRILYPTFPDKFFNIAKAEYLGFQKFLAVIAIILSIVAVAISGFGKFL